MTLREHLAKCTRATTPLLTEDSEVQGMQCSYDLQADNTIFAGHFPENPILPAVVQCLMVQCLAEELTQDSAAFYHIDDAKFVAPVIPPCEVVVRVVRGRKEGLFAGTVHIGGQLHAKISLLHEARA